MKKVYKIICGISFAALLVGCDSRIDAVNQQMANIRNEQPLPIEPAPVFTPVPSFNYSAQQLRSPFLPSSLANELKIMSGKRVYPNFSRQSQPLESYPLESLTLKGSMKSNTGQIVGLIQTPDGEIERVQRGNYMGMNQGRIIEITPTRIDLLEIVPDGRDGYIERPRSLVLIGPVD
ncbi:pilus assembly protein PilP [Acinetobacter rongchengensis]|uniref:Pilus assembly protein PilP n=1 Tax=Acinetobacter rongchengensis TaxID=2419601 RepID=A0A3A8F0B6_9GAMM|nr:pilus assembly protein PilP [Acinetobacter rongchengensis]RKG40447.1 pilus assembly protein PilP [Acinetobacter rongchengensis]